MTDEGYESWQWGYWHGKDYIGYQWIKKETASSKAIAIKEAIDIVIGGQTWNRDQVDVDHDKQSRSEECVPHHVTRDQQNNRNQAGDQDRDRDQ